MRTFTAALLLVCLLPFGATRAAVVDIHVTSSADSAAVVDIHVTSSADSGANTLRQAIIDGNALVANNNVPRILIDLNGSSPIVLTSPLPNMTATSFQINGAKAGRAVIDGNDAHRILVTDSTVLLFGLKNVALLNGFSTTTSSACLGMAAPASTGYATLENVQIQGCKQAAAGIAQGAAISTAHNLTIKNSTFQFNESVGTSSVQGGAIFIGGNVDLTIRGTYIGSNRAVSNGPAGGARASGGAIHMLGGASITIDDSVFTSNYVKTSNDPGPSIRFGGALDVRLSGALVVRRSAFVNNDAGEGGAIYHWGTPSSTPTVELRNVTAFANQATLGSGGFLASTGVLTLYNNTFWRNSASMAGDNLAGTFGATIHTAYNNLFAAGKGAGDSCTGFTMSFSAGYNIVPAIECGLGVGSTDKVTSDLHIRGAYMGPGQDYTVQLYARSPALDAGNPLIPDDTSFARCTETDSIGQPRPVDASATGAPAICDIGSLEAQSEPPLFIDDFEPRWLRP